MDKLIVVSSDSHAGMPSEMWAEYLEPRFHEYLPMQLEDSADDLINQLSATLTTFPPEVLNVMDKQGVWASGGYHGLWDADRRLQEMDREGIAAELINPGDPRAPILFAPMTRSYPQEVVAAGMRAYHRWAVDEFGAASDRLLLVGDAAVEVDMQGMLAELEWMAEHNFAAAYVPGRVGRTESFPALYDQYFEPFWSKCEDLGMPVVIHAGYGVEHAETKIKLDRIHQRMVSAGRTNFLEECVLYGKDDFFELDLRPRRAMWQMMLGGVFDRHPRLQLAMVEVRGDWLPDTLRRLDEAFLAARNDLPAKRLPSEAWKSNCLAALSFMHKAELDMRYDIGIDTISFGRDYPHAEGTWPNTDEWLSDLFQGVSEDEIRQMLGENAIRALQLDRERLVQVANRIGPSIEQIIGRSVPADPLLIENWNSRGGYLKPAPVFDRQAVDALLSEDLVQAAATK